LARYARQVLLYGRDARLLDDTLNKHVNTQRFDDLPAAMQAAYELSLPGDCVLLSPACASLDQFTDYQQRGDVFCQWIENKMSQAGGSQ